MRILPLTPELWAGYHDRINVIKLDVTNNLGLLPTVKQTHKILEMGLPESLADIRTDLAKAYFETTFKINTLLEIFESLEGDMRPDGIVLHNDVEPLTRSIALWGIANNIPVIHIPHAFNFYVWRDKPNWDIHDQVTANYIAAINPPQEDWYKGLDAENVVVCGSPKWDSWANFTITPQKARTILGIPLDSPTALYMASWPQSTSLFGMHGLEQNTFIEYCKAVKTLGWESIIMFHYNASDTNNKWYVETASSMGIKGVATKEHFQLAIQAADVVVSFGPSNALIEASIINKPTLCIGTEADFVTSVSSSSEAISLQLTSMINKGANQNTLILAPYVGESADRIARWIGEICIG